MQPINSFQKYFAPVDTHPEEFVSNLWMYNLGYHMEPNTTLQEVKSLVESTDDPKIRATFFIEAVINRLSLDIFDYLVNTELPITHVCIHSIISLSFSSDTIRKKCLKLAVRMILKGGETHVWNPYDNHTPLSLCLFLQPFPGKTLLINSLLSKNAIVYGEPTEEQLTTLSTAYDKYRSSIYVLFGRKDVGCPFSQIPMELINHIAYFIFNLDLTRP